MDQMKILEELKNDKEFLEKLSAAKDNDAEMAKLFNEKGIDVTEDAIKAIRNSVNSEELDETSLDNVAGGFGLIEGIVIGIFGLFLLLGYTGGK